MNRELDIAIALLLGWRWVDDGGVKHLRWHDAPGFAAMEAGGEVYPTSLLLRYSTDVSAAWMVVEWLHKYGSVVIEVLPYAVWVYIQIVAPDVADGGGPIDACRDFRKVHLSADTAPLAICRAALRAVGGREGE